MKVLLAIDGSPCSDAAVESVAKRPWPPNTEIRLITVDPTLEYDFLRKEGNSAFDRIVASQRAQAAGRLATAVEILKQISPGARVTSHLREGHAKEVILEEAERWKADLVVVGSHGYGMVERFLLGSVSLAVATNAPCSVEIVRAPVSAPDAKPATSIGHTAALPLS